MIRSIAPRRAALVAAAFAVAMPAFSLAGASEQPRMQDALVALQAARDKLANAVPDKGGHRVIALRLVDQALAQVRLGVQAGDLHR